MGQQLADAQPLVCLLARRLLDEAQRPFERKSRREKFAHPRIQPGAAVGFADVRRPVGLAQQRGEFFLDDFSRLGGQAEQLQGHRDQGLARQRQAQREVVAARHFGQRRVDGGGIEGVVEHRRQRLAHCAEFRHHDAEPRRRVERQLLPRPGRRRAALGGTIGQRHDGRLGGRRQSLFQFIHGDAALHQHAGQPRLLTVVAVEAGQGQLAGQAARSRFEAVDLPVEHARGFEPAGHPADALEFLAPAQELAGFLALQRGIYWDEDVPCRHQRVGFGGGAGQAFAVEQRIFLRALVRCSIAGRRSPQLGGGPAPQLGGGPNCPIPEDALLQVAKQQTRRLRDGYLSRQQRLAQHRLQPLRRRQRLQRLPARQAARQLQPVVIAAQVARQALRSAQHHRVGGQRRQGDAGLLEVEVGIGMRHRRYVTGRTWGLGPTK